MSGYIVQPLQTQKTKSFSIHQIKIIKYRLVYFRRNHKFSLSCKVPVDFEYQLTKLQDDDAFTVGPLTGKERLSMRFLALDFAIH